MPDLFPVREGSSLDTLAGYGYLPVFWEDFEERINLKHKGLIIVRNDVSSII
jgi:hypothetical protein